LPEGTVISQSRKAGTRIMNGTSLVITVAKKKSTSSTQKPDNDVCSGGLC